MVVPAQAEVVASSGWQNEEFNNYLVQKEGEEGVLMAAKVPIEVRKKVQEESNLLTPVGGKPGIIYSRLIAKWVNENGIEISADVQKDWEALIS